MQPDTVKPPYGHLQSGEGHPTPNVSITDVPHTRTFLPPGRHPLFFECLGHLPHHWSRCRWVYFKQTHFKLIQCASTRWTSPRDDWTGLGASRAATGCDGCRRRRRRRHGWLLRHLFCVTCHRTAVTSIDLERPQYDPQRWRQNQQPVRSVEQDSRRWSATTTRRCGAP